MRYKELFRWLFLPALTVCLTGFLFAPVNTFFTNIYEYSFVFEPVFLTFLTLSLMAWVVYIVLFGLGLWLARSKKRKQVLLQGGAIVATFLASMLWLQGNVIAPDIGVLDGRRILWRELVTPVLINILIWLVAVVIFVRYRNKLVPLVVPVCVILLAMQGVNLGVQYATMPEPANFQLYTNDESSQYRLSSDANVVLIVLDTFQADVFEEVLVQKPELKQKLDGFVYYPDTAGGYPGTILSIPLLMTGEFYQNQKPYHTYEQEAYLSSSIPKDLHDLGFDVYMPCKRAVYCSEVYSDSVLPKPVRHFLDADELEDVLRPTVIRTVPTVMYMGYQKGRYYLSLWLGEEMRWTDDTSRWFEEDIALVNSIVTKTTSNNSKPAFRYYHFTAPHPPFYLDQEGEFSEQVYDRQGQVNHATGAFGFAMDILDRYRELGIYDQTMIVIMADHGFGPFGYKPGVEEEVVSNEIHASAMPMLLVKPFESSSPFRVDETAVSFATFSDDLVEYVEELSMDSAFEFELTELSERRFYYYKNSDPHESGFMPTMQQFRIVGPVRDETSWQEVVE